MLAQRQSWRMTSRMTGPLLEERHPSVPAMTGRDRFVAAARREAVDTTPVWFMRQAGRSLPEYRALREKHEFMTVATTPELAVAATLMPVHRLGVDAAVLFADIMLPLASLGVEFVIQPNVGPVVPRPIRTAADVDRLTTLPPEEATPFVLEASACCGKSLPDGRHCSGSPAHHSRSPAT